MLHRVRAVQHGTVTVELVRAADGPYGRVSRWAAQDVRPACTGSAWCAWDGCRAPCDSLTAQPVWSLVRYAKLSEIAR